MTVSLGVRNLDSDDYRLIPDATNENFRWDVSSREDRDAREEAEVG
jgi:hypothetical protein